MEFLGSKIVNFSSSFFPLAKSNRYNYRPSCLKTHTLLGILSKPHDLLQITLQLCEADYEMLDQMNELMIKGRVIFHQRVIIMLNLELNHFRSKRNLYLLFGIPIIIYVGLKKKGKKSHSICQLPLKELGAKIIRFQQN